VLTFPQSDSQERECETIASPAEQTPKSL
jgi:hypothetical protein